MRAILALPARSASRWQFINRSAPAGDCQIKKIHYCSRYQSKKPPSFAHSSSMAYRSFSSGLSLLRPEFIDPAKLESISETEVEEVLRARKIHFEFTPACVKISIPKRKLILSQGTRDPDKSLITAYFVKNTKYVLCPALAKLWHWDTFVKFLQKNESHPSLSETFSLIPADVTDKINQQLSGCTQVRDLSSRQFKRLKKILGLDNKRLKQSDFQRLGAYVSATKKELLFPVKYPNYSGGKAVVIGLRKVFVCPEENKLKETNHFPDTSLPANCVFPFPHGLDNAWSSDDHSSVIIVASVLDTIALMSDGIQKPVVALHNGIANLPPTHIPFFEPFDESIFWFPKDNRSFTAASAFAKKMGKTRCRIMSPESLSPLQSVLENVSLKKFLEQCSLPNQTKDVITFRDLRDSVFEELSDVEKFKGTKFQRFSDLNNNLGGFRPGELTIFSGRTGAGKTTFMSEYSIDLCEQGIKTLWGSFEVSNTRLSKMQLKQHAGIAFEPDMKAKQTDEEKRKVFDAYADRFEALSMYYLSFHGPQEWDKVLKAIYCAVYLYDIEHVIIDNMQFMMGVSSKAGYEKFFHQDSIVQKIRELATQCNVHVTLVMHPRKEEEEELSTNSIYGGCKATQEADNVLLLQTEEVPTAKPNETIHKKYLQVSKNRYTGQLGRISLLFCRSTLTLSKLRYLEWREKYLNKNKL